MKVRNNVYAYPVLSSFNDDYIDSEFEVNFISGRDDIDRLFLEVNVNLNNYELELLIKRNNAKLILHIECSHTSQREIITLSKNKYIFYIDEKKFSGNVDLNVFIIANTNIPNYSNSNFNKKIFGENYSIKLIEKGMILAATITQNVDIINDKDSLKNLASIIKVTSDKQNEEMLVEYSGDIILVVLPVDEFQMYNSLSRTKYADLVLTSVILPSLVYVLEGLRSQEDLGLTWFRVISNQIEKLGYSIDDIGETIESLQLAQKILGRPLKRSLDPSMMED